MRNGEHCVNVEKYIALVKRHIGRAPEPSDGVAPELIRHHEQRIGVRLPTALREYYRIAGVISSINQAHNRLATLEELGVEDRFLIFMAENQEVVHWGIPEDTCDTDDPEVWQRNNDEVPGWYAAELSVSEFLVRNFDWQAGFGGAPY
jgi:hypothetical protein